MARATRQHPLACSLASYPPQALGDVSGLLDDVKGWLSDLEQGLQGAKTQVTKIDNAITGGAAGAQAGYRAPTDWRPWILGGFGLIAVIFIVREL